MYNYLLLILLSSIGVFCIWFYNFSKRLEKKAINDVEKSMEQANKSLKVGSEAQLQNIPEMPQIPGMSMAEMPEIPGMPMTEMPQIPGMPMTEMPQIPGMPMTEMPQIPGMPMTEMPQMPGMPMTAMPGMQDMPHPGMPQVTEEDPENNWEHDEATESLQFQEMEQALNADDNAKVEAKYFAEGMSPTTALSVDSLAHNTMQTTDAAKRLPHEDKEKDSLVALEPSMEKRALVSPSICNWGASLHLSSLLLLTKLPLANILFPALIWLLKKEENDFIHDQGKAVINFQLTVIAVEVLFTMVGLIIMLLVPDLRTTILLLQNKLRYVSVVLINIRVEIFTVIPMIFGCIFAARGAWQSYSGIKYRYPFSIDFCRLVNGNSKTQESKVT